MKAILLILSIALIGACTAVPEQVQLQYNYEFARSYAVPDSLKQAQQQWIIDETKAASNGLSAGDYEEPWVLVRVVIKESEELFGVQSAGLISHPCTGCEGRFIPYAELTDDEKTIFWILDKTKP